MQNEGVRQLIKRVASGDVAAQTELEKLFLQQAGSPGQLGQAVCWLQDAAEAGCAEAQFQLGVRYAHGMGGVAQDHIQAVKWLREAARQGHAGAQDSLGVRYATGQGVPQDDAQAAYWFRLAAEQNHAVAQFNLGLAHVYGQGVAQDYLEAFVWFSLSALQGDAIAAEGRDRVAESLSFPQLKEAKIRFHQQCRKLSVREKAA